ncbi:shikimate kinase [Pelagibacterium limicola]|uniref:shikimate kinase n=1 Tax=Pelagibacterium limicola TaxID=2791022 RepID=UPI0018AF79C4|nr:shikimate kinase [Pelagibacterium limicola]
MGQDATKAAEAETTAGLVRRLAGRPIVIVGMMGSGKTTVGRRLATRLGLDFVDSDAEIETAAAMTIPEIFAAHGEDEFRAGEARVIARLLREHSGIIATGGGAFINEETRALVKANAVSIWLKADFELLFARVSKRSNRPLLQTPDPRGTLKNLIDARYPTYALADITVTSRDVPHDSVVDSIMSALAAHLANESENADTR